MGGLRHAARLSAEEETERMMSDTALLKRLLGQVLVYRGRLAICLVLVVVGTAIALLLPYFYKIAIDRYLEPVSAGNITVQAALKGLVWLSSLYLLLSFVSYLISMLRGYLLRWIGQSVMRDLRNRMFSHLQKMSKSFFDKSEVGRLISRVTSDVETISEVFATGLVDVFSNSLRLVAILVIMLLINVKLTLISLATIPILLGAALLFRSKARKAYMLTRKKIAGVMSNLQESISGIRVAQSFSREDRNAQRFDRVNVENLRANVYAAQVFSMFYPTVQIIGAIGLALIIYFGGIMVIGGGITLGLLVLFEMYVMQFFSPIMSLTMFYNSIQSAFAAADRIFGLLETPPEVADSEGAEDVGRVEGRVDFNHVEFAYVPGVPVLKDFNLHVRPRENLAIVGPTGAGKSTVMNLLLRFYDVNRGSVAVDGRDIRTMTLSSLRRNMAIVLQDTVLFSGSIADNIRYGRPDASDDEVRSVAKIVGADEFISRLIDGYDTLVTERGQNLSVGQRQLISFARALLVDPPILLLDEATSSVDPYTEFIIQNALTKLLENRTSIVIAHRLSTVRNADRIIVMDQGRIVEEGSHEELLARGGMYRELCEMQLMGISQEGT